MFFEPLALCKSDWYYGNVTLQEPLSEKERKKLHELISNPEAVDALLDKALKGWRRKKSWKKQTKRS